MAHVKVDRVQQTTQSTGTGALVLDGAAIPRMFRFQDSMANGSDFWGLIEHATANEVEISLCTYNAGVITRSFATGSRSSTGGLVPFSGGTKTISVIAPAGATPIVDGSGNMSVPGGLNVGGAIVAGLSAGITHNFKQGNNSLLAIGSAAPAEIYIEAVQATNTVNKYDLCLQQFGGNTRFGGSVGVGKSPTATLDVGGSILSNNLLMQGTVPHAYIRPINSSGTLFLGANNENYVLVSGVGGHFMAVSDNVTDCGGPSNRWANLRAGNGTVITSDQNDKSNIRPPTPTEVAVGRRLAALVRFWQFNDAIAIKGENARLHAGWVAQDVVAAFAAEGLDAFRYGCVGFDELTKPETYIRMVSREKKLAVPETVKVVEIVDGQPVRMAREVTRAQPVGEWKTVTDNGEIVMVDSGVRSSVTGEPVMVALQHFVPEMEEVPEEATRTVPDLDENGERKIRLNVRPDQLHAFVIAAQESRLAALEV